MPQNILIVILLTIPLIPDFYQKEPKNATFAKILPMDFEILIVEAAKAAILALYKADIPLASLPLQKTRKEFEGDYTLVVFSLTAHSKLSPDKTGEELGTYMLEHSSLIESFNVIKGFLNLKLKQDLWINFFSEAMQNAAFGIQAEDAAKGITLLEYSSPNTNKPLHLGHVRNNLLGSSLARILEANGQKVVQVNLVNDRGIHICKSMLAWQKWGNGERPETNGLKGDHLVGKYYVLFDQHYRAEIETLIAEGMDKEQAAKNVPLILEAQDLLKKWEMHDEPTLTLWRMMNQWVYTGFEATYQRMGIAFDRTYHESETYLLGKELVEEGLQSKAFYRKDDTSVWADLSGDGLDEKLLLRADGTSVYITQDLGTANDRYKDYHPSKMIYVVGNEQNYHFDVLRFLLKKLDKDWWDKICHYSYGMVELPHGKMKSREGTVVDADELLEEMFHVARTTTEELGKVDGFKGEEATALYWKLALGALKYFILKVDPKKNMMFNPEESIDFAGNTGPFIQYTHARIKTLYGKAVERQLAQEVAYPEDYVLSKVERNLLRFLVDFPLTVKLAGDALSPALIANYVYDLAREYNHFYQEIPVLREDNAAIRSFRLSLSLKVAGVIGTAMGLLGVEVPERM